jgi:hypothetical protein
MRPGIGLVFGPMVTVAMFGVAPKMAGAASGVLNTIRQIGTAIGSAAVGAVLQNRLASSLPDGASRWAGGFPEGHADAMARFQHGFVEAVRAALALSIAMIALGAVACALVRHRPAVHPGKTREMAPSAPSC